MELLPLLIFLGGIIYSAIASQKNKGRKEQRNIDPGKLNNPAKRSSRPGSSGRQGSSRGFFEQRSEEHTSELQSRGHLVCRLLLEKKKKEPASRIENAD